MRTWLYRLRHGLGFTRWLLGCVVGKANEGSSGKAGHHQAALIALVPRLAFLAVAATLVLAGAGCRPTAGMPGTGFAGQTKAAASTRLQLGSNRLLVILGQCFDHIIHPWGQINRVTKGSLACLARGHLGVLWAVLTD